MQISNKKGRMCPNIRRGYLLCTYICTHWGGRGATGAGLWQHIITVQITLAE